MVRHKMIKNIEEKKECLYCMYCGSKLKTVSLNLKICPKDCVEVTFKSPIEALHELFNEEKLAKLPKAMGCGCEYPMIS